MVESCPAVVNAAVCRVEAARPVWSNAVSHPDLSRPLPGQNISITYKYRLDITLQYMPLMHMTYTHYIHDHCLFYDIYCIQRTPHNDRFAMDRRRINAISSWWNQSIVLLYYRLRISGNHKGIFHLICMLFSSTLATFFTSNDKRCIYVIKDQG